MVEPPEHMAQLTSLEPPPPQTFAVTEVTPAGTAKVWPKPVKRS